MSEQPKLRLGAERLEATRQNAEFWLNAGRKEPDRSKAITHVEQSVFAWKNAAYGLAEELAQLKESNEIASGQLRYVIKSNEANFKRAADAERRYDELAAAHGGTPIYRK